LGKRNIGFAGGELPWFDGMLWGGVDRIYRLISVFHGVSTEAEDGILPKDTDDIPFSAALHSFCGGLVTKSRTWRSIAIIKFMDKFRDLGLEILCEFSE
jgi:hypothetical protein